MNSMSFSIFPLREMKYCDDNNSHSFQEISKNEKLPQNYYDNVGIGSKWIDDPILWCLCEREPISLTYNVQFGWSFFSLRTR